MLALVDLAEFNPKKRKKKLAVQINKLISCFAEGVDAKTNAIGFGRV